MEKHSNEIQWRHGIFMNDERLLRGGQVNIEVRWQSMKTVIRHILGEASESVRSLVGVRDQGTCCVSCSVYL